MSRAPGSRADDPERGRAVGKYHLLARLSVGGMAELFLAFLPGPGGFRKFVALKQILPEARRDEMFVNLFLDEARITAALTHPNIGQVFELGRDERSGELFLAMEFIQGQNLGAVIGAHSREGKHLPVGVSCRIARDLCLALHAAHTFVDPAGRQLPVVHRDVNPKNVMVSYSGHVKVIDFGIAKARGRLASTEVGQVRGTIAYMAPEQLLEEPLDGSCDQFSAGIVLHELLTGSHLHSRGTAAALEILEGVPVAPSTRNPEVTAAIDALVLKALAKSPGDRFESCKALARALEQACPGLADDDELAAMMRTRFAHQLSASRALFEAASVEKPDARELLTLANKLTGPSLEPAPPARANAETLRQRPVQSNQDTVRSEPETVRIEPVPDSVKRPEQGADAPRPAGPRRWLVPAGIATLVTAVFIIGALTVEEAPVVLPLPAVRFAVPKQGELAESPAAQAFRRVLANAAPDFQSCLDRYPDSRLAPRGVIPMRWMVKPDGHPASVFVEAEDVGSQLRGCLEQVASLLTFPEGPPRAVKYDVTWP